MRVFLFAKYQIRYNNPSFAKASAGKQETITKKIPNHKYPIKEIRSIIRITSL